MNRLVDLEALAASLGLAIPDEYHAGVAAQYLALMTQAELVVSQPLEDELEPASVFTP